VPYKTITNAQGKVKAVWHDDGQAQKLIDLCKLKFGDAYGIHTRTAEFLGTSSDMLRIWKKGKAKTPAYVWIKLNTLPDKE